MVDNTHIRYAWCLLGLGLQLAALLLPLRAKAERMICDLALCELLDVGRPILILIVVHRNDIDAAAVPLG